MTETYKLAYALVVLIDDFLENGGHFRDVNGTPLLYLDEVILAIQEGRWPVVQEQELALAA